MELAPAPPSAATRRSSGRIRAFVIVGAMVVALAVPATSVGGKGSGNTSSAPWIALGGVDGSSLAAASQPRLGASVWFATGYPKNTSNPWVSLRCYQDGVLVYGEGGVPSHTFVLGGASSDWVAAGGAAACTAELGDLYWRGGRQYYTYMAETSFYAASN